MPNAARPAMLLGLCTALLLPRNAPAAAPYPVRACVTKKVEATAAACRGILLAWAQFGRSGNAAARTAAVAHIGHGLASRWGVVEKIAASKGADCSETSGTAGETATLLDSAAGAFVDRSD